MIRDRPWPDRVAARWLPREPTVSPCPGSEKWANSPVRRSPPRPPAAARSRGPRARRAGPLGPPRRPRPGSRRSLASGRHASRPRTCGRSRPPDARGRRRLPRGRGDWRRSWDSPAGRIGSRRDMTAGRWSVPQDFRNRRYARSSGSGRADVPRSGARSPGGRRPRPRCTPPSARRRFSSRSRRPGRRAAGGTPRP